VDAFEPEDESQPLPTVIAAKANIAIVGMWFLLVIMFPKNNYLADCYLSRPLCIGIDRFLLACSQFSILSDPELIHARPVGDAGTRAPVNPAFSAGNSQ
jgi:hypothetical protein